MSATSGASADPSNNGRRFTSYMNGNIEKGVGLVYFASAYDGTALLEALASPVFRNEHPPSNRAARVAARPNGG